DRHADDRAPQASGRLLHPDQPDPSDEIGWTATRLQGDEPLAERASRKLINDGQLATTLGSAILEMKLDRVPLWRGDHVLVSELRDFYAQYLYLERLQSPEVLRSEERREGKRASVDRRSRTNSTKTESG